MYPGPFYSSCGFGIRVGHTCVSEVLMDGLTQYINYITAGKLNTPIISPCFLFRPCRSYSNLCLPFFFSIRLDEEERYSPLCWQPPPKKHMHKQQWMFSQPSRMFYSRGEKNLNLIKGAGIDLIVATVCWWLMIDWGFLDCQWEVRSKITTPGFFFSISNQSFSPLLFGKLILCHA